MTRNRAARLVWVGAFAGGVALAHVLGGCLMAGPGGEYVVPEVLPGSQDPDGRLARCQATGLSYEECCKNHQEVEVCQTQ